MPWFVAGGPDLPPEPLRPLDEDRLVLFCGAGISIDTGLPSFAKLDEEAFAGRNIPLEGNAKAAFVAQDFDRALDLLERTEDRDSRLMRRMIAERLVAEPEGPDAELGLHRALLDLARRPGSGFRLVTTNFDDRFERAGLLPHEMEEAPRLAPPRFEQLRRVVFLHGRIRKTDPSSHGELVLTGRDLGNAYLRDGWAARFVLELLREFDLLLIGYSLSDPVMRYLLDAIAPESRPGGRFRTVWALGSFDPDQSGDEEKRRTAWVSKQVRPILYPARNRDHRVLRETLAKLARILRGGPRARADFALEILREPTTSKADANRLDLVSWALAEPTGRTARAVVGAAFDPHRNDADRHGPKNHRRPPPSPSIRSLRELRAAQVAVAVDPAGEPTEPGRIAQLEGAVNPVHEARMCQPGHDPGDGLAGRAGFARQLLLGRQLGHREPAAGGELGPAQEHPREPRRSPERGELEQLEVGLADQPRYLGQHSERQLGRAPQQLAQRRRGQRRDPALALRHHARRARSTVDRRQLAHVAARADLGQGQLAAWPAGGGDPDPPLDHEQDVGAALLGLDDRGASRVAAKGTAPGDRLQGRLGQALEQLDPAEPAPVPGALERRGGLHGAPLAGRPPDLRRSGPPRPSAPPKG